MLGLLYLVGYREAFQKAPRPVRLLDGPSRGQQLAAALGARAFPSASRAILMIASSPAPTLDSFRHLTSNQAMPAARHHTAAHLQ